AETTFTYTQLGSDLAVADATVAYTDASGNPLRRPLADFTSKSTLSPGDAVAIGGASFLSPISLSTSAGVVAAREARTAAWLQAMGVPLPLAATDGGEARYRLTASGGLSFSFNRLEMPEGNPREVQDATFSSSGSASGTLALAARAEGQALNVTLEASLAATSDLAASATLTGRDGSGPAGVRQHGEATLAGVAALRFLGGTLSQAGAGGSVHADATLQVREPGEAGYAEPPGMSHPLVDETVPFEWSSPLQGEAAPADVVAFLQQLYGLSLVPGDRFTVRASAGPGPVGGELSYDLSVAARQDRTVAGTTVPALKLLGTYGLAVRLNGRPDTLRSFAFTEWVDADTLLPLEVSWEATQTFSEDDLAPVRDLVRSFAEGTVLPDQLDLQATLTGSVTLTRLAPGLRAAAATAIGGATVLWLPMAIGGFAMASESHAVQAAPMVGMEWDETAGQLTIVRAGNDLSFSELLLGANVPLHVAVNGPADASSPAVPAHATLSLGAAADWKMVEEGDVISLCSAAGAAQAEIQVVHEPTNTLLYVRQAGVAACP
ncbi:MAG TPA: hypothetical protein VHI93_08650, partial [Candidatus Thermoplasmatota archaeon]|nr:hypothetical protein [Candidatus Thermoplasmatota archaeon]